MSYIKRFLDEVNEHFIANASRVELHWMEQEYEKHKQEQNEKHISEIEVEAEVVTGKEATQKSASEVGGSRHNSPEVFNHQPIPEVRTQRDVGGGVLPKSKEQGDTSS